jgi:addiction module HigA family antidote
LRAILKSEDPEGDQSVATAAERIGVPSVVLYDLIEGLRKVDDGLAIRLAMLSGTSPQFWLNMQAAHDAAQDQTGPARDTRLG